MSAVEVHIPSPLRAYTRGASEVHAEGETLDALLDDLDRHFRGIRYRMVDEQRRIRPHMRLFVNDTQTFDLHMVLSPNDRVMILQALSGG